MENILLFGKIINYLKAELFWTGSGTFCVVLVCKYIWCLLTEQAAPDCSQQDFESSVEQARAIMGMKIISSDNIEKRDYCYLIRKRFTCMSAQNRNANLIIKYQFLNNQH